MRKLRASLILTLVLAPISAYAQSGFYLPVAPTSYGQDEFRAADGTTCRSSMDGTKRVEVGAFGSQGKGDTNDYSLPGYTKPAKGNTGVYGRVTISLDAAPSRMNCNLLYKLEIERRMLELEIMKRSLNAAERRLDDLKQSGGDQLTATEAAPDPAQTRTASAAPVERKIETTSSAWKLRGVAAAPGRSRARPDGGAADAATAPVDPTSPKGARLSQNFPVKRARELTGSASQDGYPPP